MGCGEVLHQRLDKRLCFRNTFVGVGTTRREEGGFKHTARISQRTFKFVKIASADSFVGLRDVVVEPLGYRHRQHIIGKLLQDAGLLCPGQTGCIPCVFSRLRQIDVSHITRQPLCIPLFGGGFLHPLSLFWRGNLLGNGDAGAAVVYDHLAPFLFLLVGQFRPFRLRVRVCILRPLASSLDGFGFLYRGVPPLFRFGPFEGFTFCGSLVPGFVFASYSFASCGSLA